MTARRSVSPLALPLLALLLLAGCPAALAAQDPERAAAGKSLAQDLCADCHAADRSTRQGPGFEAIGSMNSATALSLKVFLRSSHGRMPNVVLTDSQIDALVSYILDRGGK